MESTTTSTYDGDDHKHILHRLQPEEYEHQLDKQALNTLEKTRGMDLLMKSFYKYGLDRILKIQYTGSDLKVNAKNLPDIAHALERVCHIIHLKKVPPLYIRQGSPIEAFTAGVEAPIIILNEGCIEKLNQDELFFVLGHEIAHIKSQHTLYHQLGAILPIMGDMLSSATLGIGGLLSTGLQLALFDWQRKSEFTCDRAGLLACQNGDAAVTTLMKIAGYPSTSYHTMNPAHFLEQAKEFENFNLDTLDKLANIISVMERSHPWTVMRCAELRKWVDAGRYDELLNTHSEPDMPHPQPKPEHTVYCASCGKLIKTNAAFCIYCGTQQKDTSR